MKTRLIDAQNADIKEVCSVLSNGGIVGIPTETVYGLAANALDSDAVRRIFEAKGRPQDNPLILHIGNMEMLYDIAQTVNPLALTLAEHFWPGPLTMIFPKKAHIPSETCGGLDTAAVRMPRNSFTLRLISECGFPLAAPSANISGLPSPTKAEHVLRDMNGKIPIIIDGGSCDYGVESTVISFDDNKIRILRPGAVTAEMLREFADVVIDSGVLEKLDGDSVVLSPGMKYKHYSPKADVYILDGYDEQIERFMTGKNDCSVGFLGYGNENIPENVRIFPYGDTSEKQAENLFSSLREADDSACTEVYVRMPEKEGFGLAVYNRLLRSAAFRIIKLGERKNTAIVGLTGMSGAGKSTASKVFSELGHNIIDCDRVSREVVEKGMPALKEISEEFGAEYLNDDGSLNRRKLGNLVFSDADKRLKLNSIIYPHITERVMETAEKLGENGARIVIVDAPTLFESGLDSRCDCIISVVADIDDCIRRITARDNISEEQAKNRLSSQFAAKFYAEKSDYCIINDGSLNELENKVREISAELGELYG